MYVSPRTPVYLSNIVTHVVENRFYLDLNRNGRFDGNGLVPETNNLNLPTGITNFMVGDPEWIGVLERPDVPYGPNNKFIARYAFIAMPIGNALDLNAIHNQVFDESTPSSTPIPVNPNSANSDVYFRNQGVGSWEINLAAFLADLNTNKWGQDINQTANFYQYNQPGSGNRGAAFDDARALLAWRYANNYNTVASVDQLFGGSSGPGDIAFRHDNIDGYSDGPLQTGFQLPVDNDNANNLWPGADNTNHFFTPEELFNSNEISAPFVNRLLAAGQANSTYDRYTFYRLLSQLGTDSTPESGKMNLNYDNLDPGFNGFCWIVV